MNAYMLTSSGRDFIPAQLMSADVCITDIVHALSLICRFGGHTSEHYSVAQHSLLVARILAALGASPEVQLAGLMHDAHEAYIGDIPTPIKIALGFNCNLTWNILVGVSPFHEPATSGSWSPRWWADLFLDRFTSLNDIVAIHSAEMPTAL